MDGSEQCSSNVEEAPDPKWTKCNSIAKVRKWNGTHFRYGFFLPDGQILNVAVIFQKCKNNRVIKLLAFNFYNNCLFAEVSDKEIFDLLANNSYSGGSMTNAKVYQGFHDDKKAEEHCSRWNNVQEREMKMQKRKDYTQSASFSSKFRNHILGCHSRPSYFIFSKPNKTS